MGHLYIRHAVGSLLLWDSIKHNSSYTIDHMDGCWKIVIEAADETIANLLMANYEDLNIFLIAEDNPNDKTWYYSKHSDVKYNKEEQTITIVADVETNYIV